MRSFTLLLTLVAQLCLAETPPNDVALKIPPVKTTQNIDGQPVDFVVWGEVASTAQGAFHLAATVDLAGFQEKLTPILQTQLNQSDRCGNRLTVERAELAPAAPSAVLTAYIHYERFGCVKAFGKEIVKRLVGGNATVEVNLLPSVENDRVVLAAEVRKIDADGSLGDALRSGSFGDSLKKKITTSIEDAIQKSADLKTALPKKIEEVVSLQEAKFADGAGKLRLNLTGEIRLSAEQFQAASRLLPQ